MREFVHINEYFNLSNYRSTNFFIKYVEIIFQIIKIS